MHRWIRYGVPALVVFVAAVALAGLAAPPREKADSFRLHDFGKLPVVDGGRVKPIDTLARTSLMLVSKRSEFTDGDRKTQPAIKWLLDVMTSGLLGGDAARKHRVFRIENLEVINFLGLEHRPQSWRYSLDEIAPNKEAFDKLTREALRAEAIDPKKRDLYDQKVLELRGHLELYLKLAFLTEPLTVPGPSPTDWKSLIQVAQEARAGGEPLSAAARAWLGMLQDYSDNKPADFNRKLDDYRQQLRDLLPEEVHLAELEVSFNQFAPFYHATTLYVVVGLLAILGWLAQGLSLSTLADGLQRSAFWLAVLTLAVHTWALGTRMYIQGRPPVTNLYSSAIFVSWGCVIGGLLLEMIFKIGLGNVVAAATGYLSMIFAHHLGTSGDTLEMMQAVLDTNFWLATHVIVVNLGYVATVVAGCLGVLYILGGICTPWITPNLGRIFGQAIYGSVCAGILLSFVGTVLGGLWADQSWGRFWGWDPKENGALQVVLWNALILHARWGGLIKQRGLALLAAAGNMVVGWSWVGTNQLGVGLHAYGFNNTMVIILQAVWVSHLALIALGAVLPQRWWWSFRQQSPTSPAQTPPRSARAALATAR